MKWFEHRTTDSNDLEARLIKKEFGLGGYGIWVILQEIIANNIEGNNLDDWGFVSSEETMESLSEKIGCTVDEFQKFTDYCDENLITERRNNRLFSQYVLERMNEYARKIVKKEKSEKVEKEEISEKTEIPKNPRNNTITTQSQHKTPENVKDKSFGVSAGKGKDAKAYGDPEIDQILEAFKVNIKHIPADRKPRMVAQNVRQLITSFVKREEDLFEKLRGESLTFNYVHLKAWEAFMQKDYAKSTEKLETFKDKMKVFLDDVSRKLKEEEDKK